MQFTINRVIIKLFGTRCQNYYQEVSNYFVINTVKELVRNRFEKFRISYGAADNYLCRLISARCWTYCDYVVYIFPFLFCFFSWLPFFDGEIKLYIKVRSQRLRCVVACAGLIKYMESNGSVHAGRVAVCCGIVRNVASLLPPTAWRRAAPQRTAPGVNAP